MALPASSAEVDVCEVMVSKESQQNEKQISVDPISLKESSAGPVKLVPRLSFSGMRLPRSPSSARPKLLSFSLPNSATSSPRFSTSLLKKKWRNHGQGSPPQVAGIVSHINSPELLHQQRHLRRSKSCGEGRASAPSDDFDLWLNRGYETRIYPGLPQAETHGVEPEKRRAKEMEAREGDFKCGALCLFLPGFGKGKPVRGRKEEAEVGNVISRTVSLEKFECASWASSAIINSNEEDSMNLYFDLPMELIRTSVNDANSPVTTAFVFDKDRKGVLKNSIGRAGARRSHESARHVRFSTSNPISYPPSPTSCITPRLRKARDDFNAYLEAQS